MRILALLLLLALAPSAHADVIDDAHKELIAAAQRDDVARIKRFVDGSYGHVANINESFAADLFHAAISAHSYLVVNYFLDHGLDVNAPYSEHDAPLWDAAYDCDPQAVAELFALGGDPNLHPKGKDKAGGVACDKFIQVQTHQRQIDEIHRVLGMKPWAKFVSDSSVPSPSKDEQAALAQGRVVWKDRREPAIVLPMTRCVRGACWDFVSFLASQRVRADVERFAGKRPAASELKQDAYESRAKFDARVAEAKKTFDAAVVAYAAKVASFPEWRRGAALQETLSFVFGAPHVTARYDPDTQIFTATVSPYSAAVSNVDDFTFDLDQKIPNDAAKEFQVSLEKAAASVTFERQGGALTVVSAEFEAGWKKYSAHPSSSTAGAAALARVDLGSARPASGAGEMRVLYAGSAHAPAPAIAAPVFHSDVDEASAAAAPRPNDYAVVVGIDQYHDKNLPRAKFAERDADAVAANLKGLGLPLENIALLKGSDATSASIKSRLESWLPKNVNPESRVYFYFSGHGAPDPATGQAYLVPWDTAPNYLKETGQRIPDLYAGLGKLGAKKVLIAMDSCFSGAAAAALHGGARPLVSVQDAGEPPAGVTVLAAAQKDQIAQSLDGQGHGAFTYYFLKGLKQGMPNTDVLCGYLRKEVPSAAAKLNGSQEPVCSGLGFSFQ